MNEKELRRVLKRAIDLCHMLHKAHVDFDQAAEDIAELEETIAKASEPEMVQLLRWLYKLERNYTPPGFERTFTHVWIHDIIGHIEQEFGYTLEESEHGD